MNAAINPQAWHMALVESVEMAAWQSGHARMDLYQPSGALHIAMLSPRGLCYYKDSLVDSRRARGTPKEILSFFAERKTRQVDGRWQDEVDMY